MNPEAAGPGRCVDDEAERPPVADISTILQALADPIRLGIVRALAEGTAERPCSSFPVPVTKSTASHHFRVLHDAGLIERRCEGTRKMLSLRRAELEAMYPGLLDSVLRAEVARTVGH